MSAGQVEFDGAVAIRESDKALLVSVDGQNVWIPKSHITDDSEVYKVGHSGKLVITEWIATEKGLV